MQTINTAIRQCSTQDPTYPTYVEFNLLSVFLEQ